MARRDLLNDDERQGAAAIVPECRRRHAKRRKAMSEPELARGMIGKGDVDM